MPDTLGFMIVHTGKLLLKTINGTFSGITRDITFEQLGVLYYISRNKTKEMIQLQYPVVSFPWFYYGKYNTEPPIAQKLYPS